MTDGASGEGTSSLPGQVNGDGSSAQITEGESPAKDQEHNHFAPSDSHSPGPGGAKRDNSPTEVDDFGLPIRKPETPRSGSESPSSSVYHDAEELSRDGEGSVDEKGKRDSRYSESANQSGNEPPEIAESAQGRETTSQSGPPVKDPDKDEDDKLNSLPADTEASEPQSPSGSKKRQSKISHKRTSTTNTAGFVASEWSHQRLAEEEEAESEDDDGGWKEMPALGPIDVYDDRGRMVARAAKEDDQLPANAPTKGYTRVQEDDDVQSVNSIDEDTTYLFGEAQNNGIGVDDELRDPVSQLQATKDLLTEGQRIAYVGVTRLAIFQMQQSFESVKTTKATKQIFAAAVDSMTKWGQQTMIRLYAHMDIDAAEQMMIEQLADHGVQPGDLVPPLMQNARVRNPLAEEDDDRAPRDSSSTSHHGKHTQSTTSATSVGSSLSSSPPPYEKHTDDDDLPDVQSPSQLSSSNKLDIDLRWTVLCDLFLVIIANSTYDSRSRRLLEKVGEAMDISWLQICRFEKRVIDALEMQEEEAKEKWDESENMEKRRKMALKKRYMAMGLATVGGGLVIGLSAGLLAPVIGAGLAAGFTTIGVSGTGAFLGGVGGTALITSGATLSGGAIAVRASDRRTGAVKTFEYRPLHNNKRVNLIVTVAGWMTGGVDDVRLPYSTVDPIMGDIYSILWEPEMLKSMGETINILATEALTQGLQQVLGSTILTALMASLQLPIVLTKLSYLIDNPWNVSLARANAAGLILADSLIDRNLGSRPITLVGFSLGSRVIFSCLTELARKGAFDLVQNVYMFGSPIVANKDECLKARAVVSGRFVNGYSSNDWILGYLFRATGGGIMRVAGLAPIEDVYGVENVDVTHLVNGHMAYRAEMPKLLREVGWEVESDEFVELEDPDPDNHQARQRELIREIHEARKEAEAKKDKKKFGFFKRGKLAEKKGWEMYDFDYEEEAARIAKQERETDNRGNVLFDIEAIRAELASEQVEVKQLESTLPPMKLDLSSPSKDSTPDAVSEVTTNTKQSVSPSVPASSSQASLKNVEDPIEKSLSPADTLHGTNQGGNKPIEPLPHDDEIQMTFDTAYEVPPTRSAAGTAESQPTIPPVPDNKTPANSGLNLTHNAWADDDHADKNGDGVQLSFE